jgi:hypothetical protein
MSLRVAFDLDGTIADMESALLRVAEQLFGPNVALRPPGSEHLDAPASVDDVADNPAKVEARPEKKQVLGGAQLRQVWERVAATENFWGTLEEIEPGSVARIAALRNEHRLEVIFLTQRPDTQGDITQLQTQRWLRARGFELPSVFVLRGSRGLAAIGPKTASRSPPSRGRVPCCSGAIPSSCCHPARSGSASNRCRPLPRRCG